MYQLKFVALMSTDMHCSIYIHVSHCVQSLLSVHVKSFRLQAV